jgi:hypothetical protein
LVKHGRRDANHASIREDLRKVGCRVLDLGDVGKGCPDLLVGFRGRLVLLEIKDPAKPPSKRALTPDEEAFHTQWRGLPVVVVETIEEAVAAVIKHAA